MLLYFIRHGDPIYNPDSLTALGKEQAKALAKRLALYGLDEIYCSTSTRAQQTAQPTCDLLKKQMQLLDWAHEGHAWEQLTVDLPNGGRTWCFFHEPTKKMFRSEEVRKLGHAWYSHPDFGKFQAGMQRIEREADAFLLSLGYKHDRENYSYQAIAPHEKRVALFAHQGFGLAFLSAILDIPYPTFCTTFDLSHSSVTVIDFGRETEKEVFPKVLQLANDSHLYKEGLLTGYNNGLRI